MPFTICLSYQMLWLYRIILILYSVKYFLAKVQKAIKVVSWLYYYICPSIAAFTKLFYCWNLRIKIFKTINVICSYQSLSLIRPKSVFQILAVFWPTKNMNYIPISRSLKIKMLSYYIKVINHRIL